MTEDADIKWSDDACIAADVKKNCCAHGFRHRCVKKEFVERSVSCNGGNVANDPSKPRHFVPSHSSKTSIPNDKFIPLHVVTKNLQSIKSEDRLAGFYCELDNASFDFFVVN